MDFKSLLFCLIRWGLCALYTTITVLKWDLETICIQRINVIMTIIFAIGIDKCASILRIFLQQQSLDFEITVLQLIVYFENKRESESCTDTSHSVFDNISLYLFNIIMVSNSFYFCLVFLIVSVSCVQYYYLNGNNIHDEIYFEPPGISEDKLKQLIIPLADKYKDDDCGICLSKLNELYQKSSIQNLDQSRSEKQSQNSKDDQNHPKINYHTIICIPNCLHKYHYLCVREWFKNHTTCPFCRQNIKDLFNSNDNQNNNNHNDQNNNNNNQNNNQNINNNINNNNNMNNRNNINNVQNPHSNNNHHNSQYIQNDASHQNQR